MLTRQDVFSALFKLKNAGLDVTEQLNLMTTDTGIPKEIILFLRDNSPQFMFYRDIQKNQRTLMKNILNYEDLDVVARVKVCSSIITRAMISVEYKNVDESLLDELQLYKISNALNVAFKDRDYSLLDNVLKEYKESMLLFVNKKN